MSKKDLDKKWAEIDNKDLEISERIKRYFSIFEGEEQWINIDQVYNMYIESGQIASDSKLKRIIFKENFIANNEKLKERIKGIKYTKIGDIFQVKGGEYKLRNPSYALFDNDGNQIEEHYLYSDPLENTESEVDMRSLPKELSTEGKKHLCENIKTIFTGILRKYQDMDSDMEDINCIIMKNILKIESPYREIGENGESIKYYSIKPDGSLEEFVVR